MRLRRGDQLARAEARRRSPAASLAGAPARCLELQRKAGNRAVLRVLARLTDEDVAEIRKDKKGRGKTYQQALEKYNKAFGSGGTHSSFPNPETWPQLVKAADSVEDLLASVDDEIAKAAKWVPDKQGKEEKKPTQTTTTSEDKKQKKKEKQEKKRERQEKNQQSVVDLSGPQAPVNQWGSALPTSITTPVANAPLPQAIVPPLVPVFNLADHTNPITQWHADVHTGHSAINVSLGNVRQIVNWLGTYRPGNVYIVRGAGSGAYTGELQLKIIHRVQFPPGSNKHSTYHITLSPTVYNSLTEVGEVGADWDG
ncbi:MAG TPA: hypothetical protein VH418_20095 [Solirubrobacteraceae bacterium]|jgi:hypothetical protein